jgi:hypothetical protein
MSVVSVRIIPVVRIIIIRVRVIIPIVRVIIPEGTSKKEIAIVPETISALEAISVIKVPSSVFREAMATKTTPAKPTEMAAAEMATTGKMAATEMATAEMAAAATMPATSPAMAAASSAVSKRRGGRNR